MYSHGVDHQDPMAVLGAAPLIEHNVWLTKLIVLLHESLEEIGKTNCERLCDAVRRGRLGEQHPVDCLEDIAPTARDAVGEEISRACLSLTRSRCFCLLGNGDGAGLQAW